jgi:hypothetical protein
MVLVSFLGILLTSLGGNFFPLDSQCNKQNFLDDISDIGAIACPLAKRSYDCSNIGDARGLEVVLLLEERVSNKRGSNVLIPREK